MHLIRPLTIECGNKGRLCSESAHRGVYSEIDEENGEASEEDVNSEDFPNNDFLQSIGVDDTVKPKHLGGDRAQYEEEGEM